MTLNFGLLLLALSAEQVEMSTAMPNTLRALRADMVKVLFMLNALLPKQEYPQITQIPQKRKPGNRTVDRSRTTYLQGLVVLSRNKHSAFLVLALFLICEICEICGC